MEPNKLDTWLNDQLGDYSAELPANSWSGFQASRKRKKRRFIIWFLVAGTAASLAIGFFIGRESVKSELQIVDQGNSQTRVIPETSTNEPDLTEPKSAVQKELPVENTIKHIEPVVQVTNTRESENQTKAIVKVESNLEVEKIESSEIPSIAAQIGSLNPSIDLVELKGEKHSYSRFGTWNIAVEYGRSNLKTEGIGQNADLYNEVYSKQSLNLNALKIGVERFQFIYPNWRLSAGLFFSKTSADGQIQVDKVDTNSAPFQSYSGGGLGNVAVESLTASASEKLRFGYYAMSVPVKVWYYKPVSRFGGFLIGAGLNTSYNFNSKVNWYSADPGNQNSQYYSSNKLKPFTLSQELTLGWEQAFNSRTRFALLYSLRFPQKNHYRSNEYSIGRGFEHGFQLRYVIP